MAAASAGLVWRAFALPKAGHGREELEDAFAGDPEAGRFAVADGASESAFAALWAELLVQEFVHQRGRLADWLVSVRQRWHERCQKADMPWYLEEKFAQGAFATFLGVFFRGGRRWQAGVVGDCCLLHVRSGQLRRAFPMRRSQDFSNRPALLCSRPQGAGKQIKVSLLSGPWRADDVMLLATDALAQWFLRKVEEGNKPWEEALRVGTDEEFAAWIGPMRESKEIRNDDTTLMVIQSALL